MMEVKVIAFVYINKDEDLEKAIKRFRKKVEKESIIKDFKKRQFFVKPSEQRHIKEKITLRKIAKNLRKAAKRNMY